MNPTKKKCCANCEYLGIEEGDLFFCQLNSLAIYDDPDIDLYLNLYPLNRIQIQALSCNENYKERQEYEKEKPCF